MLIDIIRNNDIYDYGFIDRIINYIRTPTNEKIRSLFNLDEITEENYFNNIENIVKAALYEDKKGNTTTQPSAHGIPAYKGNDPQDPLLSYLTEINRCMEYLCIRALFPKTRFLSYLTEINIT